MVYNKLTLDVMLLEVSYVINAKNSARGGLLKLIKNSAIRKSVLHETVLREA